MALGVIADGADEPDVGAEAGSGDRLIRAFAARAAVEDAVGDGFTGAGGALDAGGEVDVDRADDGELSGDEKAFRSVE